MIIDLILDRRDDERDGIHRYDPVKFYCDCICYGDIGEDITRAMDYFSEKGVKEALCEYIHTNEYNPEICDYIKSVDWLKAEEG